MLCVYYCLYVYLYVCCVFIPVFMYIYMYIVCLCTAAKTYRRIEESTGRRRCEHVIAVETSQPRRRHLLVGRGGRFRFENHLGPKTRGGGSGLLRIGGDALHVVDEVEVLSVDLQLGRLVLSVLQ